MKPRPNNGTRTGAPRPRCAVGLQSLGRCRRSALHPTNFLYDPSRYSLPGTHVAYRWLSAPAERCQAQPAHGSSRPSRRLCHNFAKSWRHPHRRTNLSDLMAGSRLVSDQYWSSDGWQGQGPDSDECLCALRLGALDRPGRIRDWIRPLVVRSGPPSDGELRQPRAMDRSRPSRCPWYFAPLRALAASLPMRGCLTSTRGCRGAVRLA